MHKYLFYIWLLDEKAENGLHYANEFYFSSVKEGKAFVEKAKAGEVFAERVGSEWRLTGRKRVVDFEYHKIY